MNNYCRGKKKKKKWQHKTKIMKRKQYKCSSLKSAPYRQAQILFTLFLTHKHKQSIQSNKEDSSHEQEFTHVKAIACKTSWT